MYHRARRSATSTFVRPVGTAVAASAVTLVVAAGFALCGIRVLLGLDSWLLRDESDEDAVNWDREIPPFEE